MDADGIAVFETAIGWCGIAWRTGRVVGVLLPGPNRESTTARLRGRFPTAPLVNGKGSASDGIADDVPAMPDVVQGAVSDIVSLVAGEDSELSTIELDMTDLPPLHRDVYEYARTIPPGRTKTYGEVARAIGAPDAARAVGQALGSNPFAIVVPCHRVVASGGKTGGFSATGGVETKLRLLAIERAHAPEPDSLFALLPESDRY